MGAAVLIALIALADHGAWSQAARTIRIIIPSPPGGVTDMLARLLGEQVGQTRGVAVVIDNRPGAGEVIGTETAARAAPDGNTVLFTSISFVANPHLRKVIYHPLTSFEPICELASAPTLIVVNATSPYRTLSDLLDAARAKPGTVTMASIGPGSAFQLAFEKLKRLAKVDMTFLPYPGNGPAVNAILGGHVTMMFTTYSTVAEHLKSGELRAVAATMHPRIEALPDLPTVAEYGFQDYEVPGAFFSFAPAKTPTETVSQLANWLTAAMQVPEVTTKLAAQGLYPTKTCGAELAAYLRDQYDEFGRIIREAHIEAE